MAALSPIYDRECSGASKEALAAARSRLGPYQRQMSAQNKAGALHGVRSAQALVVDYAQDRSALTRRAGFVRMAQSNLLPGCQRHLRGSAIAAAPRLFIHVRLRGYSPFATQSLPHQHCVQALADRPFIHRSCALSKYPFHSNHIGRSKKVWRHQFPVMRCPK